MKVKIYETKWYGIYREYYDGGWWLMDDNGGEYYFGHYPTDEDLRKMYWKEITW